MIYLDTNILLYLAKGESESISQVARDLIDNAETLLISPMVELELEYLYEIERLNKKSEAVIQHLAKVIPLEICDKPLASIVKFALRTKWTRDPFDRLITAHAAVDESILITKDSAIQNHYKHALG